MIAQAAIEALLPLVGLSKWQRMFCSVFLRACAPLRTGSVSVGRASLSRQKSRNRRSLRAANGSSKIALHAGIISTCRKSWLKQMISSAGRLSCRLSPTARQYHGSISTCLVSTISQMTSCKTQWESSPQNWLLELRRELGAPRRHNSFAHKRFNKFPCRFSYLCWNLTKTESSETNRKCRE